MEEATHRNHMRSSWWQECGPWKDIATAKQRWRVEGEDTGNGARKGIRILLSMVMIRYKAFSIKLWYSIISLRSWKIKWPLGQICTQSRSQEASYPSLPSPWDSRKNTGPSYEKCCVTEMLWGHQHWWVSYLTSNSKSPGSILCFTLLSLHFSQMRTIPAPVFCDFSALLGLVFFVGTQEPCSKDWMMQSSVARDRQERKEQGRAE